MKQSNIFEMLREQYHLPSKTRLFESFSGIGCQRDAFERADIHGGIDYESVGVSEIDKHALVSYSAQYCDLENKIHEIEYPSKKEMVEKLQRKMIGYDFKAGKHTITMSNNEKEVQKFYASDLLSKNFGDISQIGGNDLPEIDVFVYSFPCTDLSKAGKQGGLNDTRSGLVYEVLRILSEMEHRPKVLIMENVVDLVQSKFIRQFNDIQSELESYGYTNYSETMNSKGYGVAQNRDRVFMVSILGDYYYEFPKPFPLVKRLKDYLEENVDEKYYISPKLINGLIRANGRDHAPTRLEEDGLSSCITTREGSSVHWGQYVAYEGLKIIPFGSYFTWENKQGDINTQCNRAANVDECALTVACTEPGKVLVREATEQGYSEAFDGDSINLAQPNSKTRRGRVGKQVSQTLTTMNQIAVVELNAKQKLCDAMIENGNLEPYDMIRHSYTNERMENLDRKESTDGISATLTTRPDTLGCAVPSNNGLRIRKLTPLECWLLMGLSATKFNLARKWCSDSALYKQAGNGIVSDVFAYILKNLK